MAKRKAARKAGGKRKATVRKRTAARTTVRAKRAAPKRRVVAKGARKAPKLAPKPRASAKKTRRKKAVVNKVVVRKKAVVRETGGKATGGKATGVKATGGKKGATRKVVTRATVPAASRKRPAVPLLRKPPSLDRERRIVSDEDEIIQSTPPSSLDLDRSASAVRSGRRALKERFDQHTETSPALTGGDVDADWESAYSVGDEAPGGDNPTPDQDIVDDIGRAVGIEYQDNEELKSEEKVAQRDRNRWELDPASSDDWEDR